MKKKLRGPNFFIIGAPKCGTSAMANFLDQHPEVCFSKPKEPMFFCQDIFSTPFKNLNDYIKRCFRDVNINHKAIGEASTAILYSNIGIQQIIDYDSNAKFIVMLRNPVDAAVSMHGQTFGYLKAHQELSEDFEYCWRCLPERQKGKMFPSADVTSIYYQYDEIYSYYKYLKKLFSFVDKEKVHIIIYDDFKQEPLSEYKKLCMFLNISARFEPKIKIINPRSQINMKRHISFLYYISRLTYDIRKLLRLTNIGLLHKIMLKNQIPLEKPQLSTEFLAEMKDFFREDIIKTSKLINRDLSMWL